MRVNYQQVQRVKEWLRSFNAVPLAEIEWVDDDGKVRPLAPRVIEEWNFTGLNNSDLPVDAPDVFDGRETIVLEWDSEDQMLAGGL